MSDILKQFSDGLAATAAKAGTAVVRVEARRRLPASGIVWSADGHILTANHVVRADEGIHVGLADGSRVAATLVGRDPSTDIAILKAEASDLTTLAVAEEDDVAVGHIVLALGRPGQSVQATMGIVSAIGARWRPSGEGSHGGRRRGRRGRGKHRHGGGPRRQTESLIQTDVVMYPGFSGGPLVSVDGTLYGMNSSGLMSGVSLALGNKTIARVASSLMTHGHIKRGYLGVSTQRVHLPDALQEELEQKAGLLVVSTETNSPAAEAGVTLGDTIVGLDGESIESHDDLLNLLTGERIGNKMPLQIVRGGEVQSVNVKVVERPSASS